MKKQKADALAKTCGADRWAFLRPADIPACADFLDACRQNRCGNYGTNWACPPAESPTLFDAFRTRFKNAMAFQVRGSMEDSFDYESIAAAQDRFDSVCACLRRRSHDAAVLGTGPCRGCETCAYPKPCRFPKRRTQNMEAAGIHVSELCARCGLPYADSDITFTGLLLWNP